MKNRKVSLVLLKKEDHEQFILDNQEAFKFGAMEEFGLLDDHIDEDGEIISRETINECINCSENESYRIVYEGRNVGGVVIKINNITNHNHLELLFVSPKEHSKGIGYGAWLEVEKLHPETKIWETCTPYFEKRNIHFYVNKCKFKIVEFYNEFNIDKNMSNDVKEEGPDEMFKFIKEMK